MCVACQAIKPMKQPTFSSNEEAQQWGEVATIGWKLYQLYQHPDKEKLQKLVGQLNQSKLIVPEKSNQPTKELSNDNRLLLQS